METCTFTQIRVFLSLITLKWHSIMCNFGYFKFTQLHNSNPNPINPRTRTSKLKPDKPEPKLCQKMQTNANPIKPEPELFLKAEPEPEEF